METNNSAQGASKQAYQQKINTINLFFAKSTDPYQLWGKMVDDSGQALETTLYERKSEKGVKFYVGYCLPSREELKAKGSQVDTNDPMTIILFESNSDHVPVEGEKARPVLTGLFTNEFGTKKRLAVWSAVSKTTNNQYFNGLLSEYAPSGSSESDKGGDFESPDQDAANNDVDPF